MLASGRPIVVTANPGTELYDLLDGAAAIVPPGDVQLLANAIKLAFVNRPSSTLQVGDLLRLLSCESVLSQFRQAIIG